ncbi:hypothetical protein IE53DRAFT_391189, partial [Violaceomyces palustris]
LASKAQAALELTSGTDVRSIYHKANEDAWKAQHEQDQKYLKLAPTFLSLHQQASASKELLSSLESFLSTFQTDLSSLSSHISALQITSQGIDQKLTARRSIEKDLADFLEGISLSPRVVDLFFETEPDTRTGEWRQAVNQLECVLEETKSGKAFPDEREGGEEPASIRESRKVAEACKNVVATKLRAYLIAPFTSIKSSVTTNIQVLQTSILLKHHRPFYAFLARQTPRVAIDVQRSYVAAARMYFETAFRRYFRSLGAIKGRWSENGTSSITDPSVGSSSTSSSLGFAKGLGSAGGASAAAMAFLSRPSSGGSARISSQDLSAVEGSDPWMMDPTRFDHAKFEGPGIILGYMADDPAFKATPESLFRSASLVLIDNACSEYTFLVRYFEDLQSETEPLVEEQAKSKASAASEVGDGVIGPDESASVVGAHAEDVEDEVGSEGSGPEPSVVQLSLREQKLMMGRGASDEIWRQVFEPSLITWSNFAKSLLQPQPPLLSLLSMIRLNDGLMRVIALRGCSMPLVESVLMAFKMQAWPILKRTLDDQVEAVKRLGGGSGPVPASSEGLDMMKGMFRAAVNAASGIQGGGGGGGGGGGFAHVKDSTIETVCARYARLFSGTVLLTEDEADDESIFSSLARLRGEVERLITGKAAKAGNAPQEASGFLGRMYAVVLKGLESGPGATSHARMQSELSHWNEMERLRRSGGASTSSI